MANELYHYGVPGMRWGVKRSRPKKPADLKKKSNEVLFVSGSSKTQDKSSPYYRRHLNKVTKAILKNSMRNGDTIIVGDAPGIDRQTQNYLKKKRYQNVEVYGPGTKVRYSADKSWKTHAINDRKHAPMSPEWLAKKDVAMTKRATKGHAVILDNGASATRNNVNRLASQKKHTTVYELYPTKALIKGFSNPADQSLRRFSVDAGRSYRYYGMKHTSRSSGKTKL